MQLRHLGHRAAITAATLGGAAALTVGLAGASYASTTTPAVSHSQFAPESFTISFPGGHGTAYGPVAGGFTDNETSPTSGTWAFDPPSISSVQVDHSAVRAPRINPRTCSGFAVDTGTWQMTGLTGRDAHALGFGRFTAYVSDRGTVDRHRGHRGECDTRDVSSETVFVSGHGTATLSTHR